MILEEQSPQTAKQAPLESECLYTHLTGLRIALFNQVPWEALQYITGYIHYGGRVTDEWDRRCLLCALNSVYSEHVLEDEFRFGEPVAYLAPAPGDLEHYREYVNQLPLEDDVSVFGLHQSAQVCPFVVSHFLFPLY